MDWNDPESFWKFINAFSRKRELGKFFEYSAPLERIEAYVYMMIKEFTFFIYWIGIVGIWQLCKRNMPLAVFTAFIFMLNTLGTVSSSAFSTENPDILGYLTISYLIYAIWIGVGFKFLTDLLSLKGTKAWNMVATFFLLGILISPLIVFLSHFSQSNKSNNYYARDYGTNIIRSIEDNSIFLLRDDNTNFILEYLIHCERLREDIRLFDQDGSWNRIFILQKRESYPELSIPSIEKLRSIQKRYRWMTTSIEDYRIHQLPQWGFKVLEKIIFENLTNYRLYWEFGEYDAIVEDRLIPNGLIFRISETREVSLTDTILKQHKALWNVEEMILWEDKEFLKDRDATKAFSFSLYYLGNYFRKRGMFLEASNYFENSIQLSPHKPQAINNLGYCYLQMNRLDEAEKQFLTMLELFGYYEKAHLNLGVVYAKRGEYAKAKSQWELVLKRNPDSPIAKENLEKLLNLSRKDM
ncbi:MAG: tetratricopeptide repeat protein [Thermodesulfobacteriota bacterium]|nr:tetratricopeptide repeat protein [Thermodesulfobacteriota bacterium]